MSDISAADFKRMQQERDAAIKELTLVKSQLQVERAAHAQERQTLKELMNKAGYKEKSTYEYKDDECRPVTLGSVCDLCQWDNRPSSPTFQMRIGREKEGRQPHAIA